MESGDERVEQRSDSPPEYLKGRFSSGDAMALLFYRRSNATTAIPLNGIGGKRGPALDSALPYASRRTN